MTVPPTPEGAFAPAFDSAPIDPIEARRKRLRFRSWHRGTREMDLLMGSFADRNVASFGPAELDAYEALLDLGDPDLYNWYAGREPVPADVDGPVLRRLLAHRYV